MNLKWHNKPTLQVLASINVVLLASVVVFCLAVGSVFARFDFAVIDLLYRVAVKRGWGPPLSPQIVYVVVTDDSYEYFETNSIDRARMADVNVTLAQYGPQAVLYDIIFARQSTPEADHQFAASLETLGNVYLPIALRYTDRQQPFDWKAGVTYERLRSEYLKRPIERGQARPFYAVEAQTQYDAFARAAYGSGNISSISSDPDGVYRHVPLLLKVDEAYFPSLAFAVFLDYVRVPFERVIVHWGKAITIPKISGSFVDRDVVIPIDEQGRVFIPYAQTWAHDFQKIALHDLLRYRDHANLQGHLVTFFEGKFVFVGDVSTGTSDLGHTPLEEDVPLLVVHTSLLNSLLQKTFYTTWPFWHVIALLCGLSLLLLLAAFSKSSRVLYVTGVVLLLALCWLTWTQLCHFTLFPMVTVGGSFLYMFLGLVIGLHLTVTREQVFIRNAFGRFVHTTVVDELVAHPEQLRLGGEERVVTVLFSDIEGFTSISEHMSPVVLVSWLNDYLTEMSDVIMAETGMIDKYIGDGIMAVFGAPLPSPDHADRAVRAGLRMQRRLLELNTKWQEQGLPQVRCRVGINTGAMLVGNLGSRQKFNYTVTGDAVNLASRLEGANKQYDTTLMISAGTYDRLTAGRFRTRLLDVVRVRGRGGAVKVFEVYGETSEPLAPGDLAYYQAYEAAFAAYLRRDFLVARTQFEAALTLRPHDVAATNMLLRLGALTRTALPIEWDGAVALEFK
jgi:adenylate cyclase